ncbi:hypothetical protein [Paraferrimonas sp. SM1919]|uniref:hypothetical protein n=1 Tax=Paraferrimonas sp. SM1919 TaxID=2662263 RepID=UPI0013D7CED2|nr:hypothetical protein [Paraferrimonas sp. SM1919]
MIKSALLIGSAILYSILLYLGLVASSSSCQLTPPSGFASTTITAFAFGNRYDELGQYQAGPVNQTLAETISSSSYFFDSQILAQWEVASFLSDYGHPQVVAIEPVNNNYLSTKGVSQQLKSHLKQNQVWFVSHQAHACRVQMTLSQQGIEGYPLPNLPRDFDSESGQIWTRHPMLYRVVDAIMRLQLYMAQ